MSTQSWTGATCSSIKLAYAARADLCRMLDKTADTGESFKRAHVLAHPEPERRFLERRLDGLT